MRLQKILAGACLCLPFLTFAYFDDVSTTHPNFQAIQYLQRKNIVNGYKTADATVFKSIETVSRAAALKMLLLAAEVKTENHGPTFTDVPNNEWFAPFVKTAADKKIVKGFPDGKFYPGAQVNQAELLKMVIYAFDAPVSLELGDTIQSDWYQPFIEFGTEFNLIDEAQPLQPLTRGAVAEIIFRTSQIKNKNFTKPYIYSGSGQVSYYGDGFHGRPTASGEIYDKNKLTAAHRTLPFGTRVKVWIGDNEELYVIVKITDRGPYHKTRVLDLSEKAFSELAPLGAGVLEVNFEVYTDDNQRAEVPSVAREKFSTEAQNIQVPTVVAESLKKNSTPKYITQQETTEIIGGTKIFKDTVPFLAETFFEKVRLYKPFPQIIRTGEVLKVSGQVKDFGHKKITFFFQPLSEHGNTKPVDPFEFSDNIEGREFLAFLPMTQPGKYQMGVVLDDERKSRIQTIEIKEADYKRTFPKSKESYTNELEIFTKPEEKTVKFSWANRPVNQLHKLEFSAVNNKRILQSVFIPGNVSEVVVPYHFFENFTTSGDRLTVDLFAAESKDGTFFYQQSNWEKVTFKNFSVVRSFADTETNDVDVFDFKRFRHSLNSFTINGKRNSNQLRLNSVAYLTQPSGNIVQIPVTFQANGSFDFKVNISTWGNYVLEIVAENGKIVFNRAFYVTKESVLPVGKSGLKTVKKVASSEVLKWINQHRQNKQIAALETDQELQAFAQKYAEQMALDDFVGHVSPTGLTFQDRINLAKLQGKFGENVAFGSNINLALGGFETSASHFSNVLNRTWKTVGVGIVQNHKGVYIAQVFRE